MSQTKAETVSMLGKLVEGEPERDAVHIAVIPVVAAEKLTPGARVTLNASGGAVEVDGPGVLGIVDPFLVGPVRSGQRFWLWLTPGSITSLIHKWTHPVIDDVLHNLSGEAPVYKGAEAHKEDSEKWLRAFAERVGVSYGVLLEDASHYLDTGDVRVQDGSQRWRGAFYEEGAAKNFWHHYEIITGRRVEDHDANPYCCSC